MNDRIPRSRQEAWEQAYADEEMKMKLGISVKKDIDLSLKQPVLQEDEQMRFLTTFVHDLRSVVQVYESSGRQLEIGYETRPHDSFEDIRVMARYTDPATEVSQCAYAGWDSRDNYLRFYAAPTNKDHLCWEVYLPLDRKRLEEVAYWFAQATGRFLMMDDYPVPNKLCGYDVKYAGPRVNRWPFDPNRKDPEWVQDYTLRLEN